MSSKNAKTLVIGVIGADCHAVGNKILAHFLTECNFTVVNLGVMVSQDEFIDAAIEHSADAILVSSIYGHGEIDCLGFRSRCDQRGLQNVVLYVGGNLVIGKRSFNEVEVLFLEMGFDRVFSPSADLNEMVAVLRQDIDQKRLPNIGTVRSRLVALPFPPRRNLGVKKNQDAVAINQA